MKYVNRLEDIIIGLLLVSVTLLVFVEVVMRFGFNSGIHWAQEATLLLSAWMVLLGASWAVREKAHICVDALVERCPNTVQKWITLLAIALSLAYCGMFLYGSWVYVNKLYIISIELDDIPLPKWVAESVLLIGFSLLVLRLLELGVQVFQGKATSFHEHNAALVHDSEEEQH